MKYLSLCFFVLLVCNCRKTNNSPEIAYTSNLYVNKVIHFSGRNVPSDCVWAFGDGTSSSGNEVTHVYTKPGKYTVVLAAKGISNISKTLSVGPDSAVMASLIGSSTYHHTDSIYRNIFSGDTIAASGTYPDTALITTLIDPTTINFYGDTLAFDSITAYAVHFHYNSPAFVVNPYSSWFTLEITGGKKHYIRRMHTTSSSTQITHYQTD